MCMTHIVNYFIHNASSVTNIRYKTEYNDAYICVCVNCLIRCRDIIFYTLRIYRQTYVHKYVSPYIIHTINIYRYNTVHRYIYISSVTVDAHTYVCTHTCIYMKYIVEVFHTSIAVDASEPSTPLSFLASAVQLYKAHVH